MTEVLQRILSQLDKLLKKYLAMNSTQLHSALAANIYAEQIAQRDYAKAQAEAAKWETRYQISLEKGREDLVKEAKICKDIYANKAANLKAMLDEQTQRLATLRHNLPIQTDLETRLRKLERELEAIKSQLLNQQAAIGKCIEQNATALKDVRTLLVNTSSQETVDPVSTNLQSKLIILEADTRSDDELAALKAMLLCTHP